jgi:hypothetical protein
MKSPVGKLPATSIGISLSRLISIITKACLFLVVDK